MTSYQNNGALPSDCGFKDIVDNHQLFVELLMERIPSKLRWPVKSEDVEDISERFRPFNLNAKDSDAIKRIDVKEAPPCYVIAVEESEQELSVKIPFKLFHYIHLVLDDYRKELEDPDEDFPFPMVIPIVFYNGPSPKVEKLNMLDVTAMSHLFKKYIPIFDYELVYLNQCCREPPVSP
jgi:hypothetical protein